MNYYLKDRIKDKTFMNEEKFIIPGAVNPDEELL
jgi:hypothetical protein